MAQLAIPAMATLNSISVFLECWGNAWFLTTGNAADQSGRSARYLRQTDHVTKVQNCHDATGENSPKAEMAQAPIWEPELAVEVVAFKNALSGTRRSVEYSARTIAPSI